MLNLVRFKWLFPTALVALVAYTAARAQESTKQLPAAPSAEAEVPSELLDKATHLYVVRRKLDAPLPRVSYFAHSAVLIETTNHHQYLIEFLEDSQVHLTRVQPRTVANRGDHLIIEMRGQTTDGPKTFEWTRQASGVKLTGEYSIATLKNFLNNKMRYYNLIFENCHEAQQSLRGALSKF